MFNYKFDIEKLYKDIKRSIVRPVINKPEPLSDEMIKSYLEDPKNAKYIVKDYEVLSVLVKKVFESSRGFFIMSYVAKYGINPWSKGFETKDELIHYANHIVDVGSEILEEIYDDIYKLKEIEDKMSVEAIREKNLEALKMELKIIENISDFEAKKPYCEALELLDTVQRCYDNFYEVSLLVLPIYIELKKQGNYGTKDKTNKKRDQYF